MTEIWCLLSLGEVKNSCSLSALFCIRIVTTSPLLSSRLPLSTNQLQFFWETFQPMQINIVLQCMWLHTTEKKKNPHLFFSGSDFVKAMFRACAWNISLTCVPVWVITSELNHDASTLFFLLKLASVITTEGGGFLLQLVFLHLCLTTWQWNIAVALSSHFVLTLILPEFGW